MASNWINLKLPSGRHHARFMLWGAGRVGFTLWLFALNAAKASLKIAIAICEMTERSTYKLMAIYDQLPYSGTTQLTLDSTAVPIPQEVENIITDLVGVLNGKHCLIVGDTGAGKSLIAQWLAYQVGGEVKVYDPDASPDEWVGLPVIGRGGDFQAINEAMTEDLEELQARIELRGFKGDRALSGMDSVLIAEEFPLLRDEVEIATEWLLKHARRGRKPKRFIIALSQDDNVKTLGIEGEGNVRKCFRVLRLGKMAVTHAKTLKNANLTQWLQAGKHRALVDDHPCQLPDLSSFKVTPQLQLPAQLQPAVTPEHTTDRELQEVELHQQSQGLSEEVIRAARACLACGVAESRIIKEVMGYKGAKYQKGKQLLKELAS